MEPFVKICLARSTEVNARINKETIITHLQDDFAFSNVPVAVLAKVLLRMSKGKDKVVECVSSQNNQFLLTQDLSSQRHEFETLQARAQEELDFVVNALLSRMHDVSPKLKATKESAIIWLGDFFESRGVDILFEVDELRTSTSANTDAINYQIGRFIIDAKENDPVLFEKIANITQGVMLVSAIYIDTRPATKFKGQRGLENCSVFLDTTLLLYAMGYKTVSQEDAATALLRLLTDSGAKLYVFPMHFQEIKDILYAFKYRDGYSQRRHQTLERLEEKEWGTTEINLEINTLEARLKIKLGVSVYGDNMYIDETGNLRTDKRAYVDLDGLSSHIRNAIHQYENNPDMLKNDVDAIGSIIAQRNGLKYETIENCPAIFVSTNYSLVREGNNFLKYLVHKQWISPAMSDTDLTTILWLKYGFPDQSIPRLLLVQHASAAIQPTDTVLEKFFQVTKNLEERGAITHDEAAFMRYDIYARNKITALCGGESLAIDDTSVLAVRDRIKERYSKESFREVAELKSKLQSAQEKNIQIQRKSTTDLLAATKGEKLAKQANVDAKNALLKDISARSEKRATRYTNIIINLLRGALMAITVFCVCLSFCAGLSSQKGVLALILAIIAACSTFVLLWPAFNVLGRFKAFVYEQLFGKIYAKEYSNIENQIKILSSNTSTSDRS